MPGLLQRNASTMFQAMTFSRSVRLQHSIIDQTNPYCAGPSTAAVLPTSEVQAVQQTLAPARSRPSQLAPLPRLQVTLAPEARRSPYLVFVAKRLDSAIATQVSSINWPQIGRPCWH